MVGHRRGVWVVHARSAALENEAHQFSGFGTLPCGAILFRIRCVRESLFLVAFSVQLLDSLTGEELQRVRKIAMNVGATDRVSQNTPNRRRYSGDIFVGRIDLFVANPKFTSILQVDRPCAEHDRILEISLVFGIRSVVVVVVVVGIPLVVGFNEARHGSLENVVANGIDFVRRVGIDPHIPKESYQCLREDTAGQQGNLRRKLTACFVL
mmetsp:Transcript_19729/g.45919  ORF Transcript_19729/g.45919 Transcript_19729/m.45919 type:complete len:210 (+) Transcript_19729:435-1064(+)